MRCMRARRVPRPLPGRLTANMRCLRARRVPRPLPGRLTANIRCMRARTVPAALSGRLTGNMRCMRTRSVPTPLPGKLAFTTVANSRACACMRICRILQLLQFCAILPVLPQRPWWRTAGPAHAFSLKCNLGLSKSIQPLISHAVSEHTQVENRPAFTRTCIK